MEKRTLGISYAALSALLLSTAFITIKKLQEYVDVISLVFQYFAIASLLLFLMILARKNVKFFPRDKGEIGVAFIIAAFGVFTSVMFQVSINLLGPSLFAFIMRLSILTAFLLGIVLLKERFSRIEAVGVFLASAGTAILTYSPGNLLPFGIAVGILTAVVIGVQDFSWKRIVKATHPLTINFYRTLATTAALAAYFIVWGGFEAMPLQQFPLLVLAAVLSPVLGVSFLIAAMSNLEVAKVVTIRTLEPFIVVVYAFIFFGTIPEPRELGGGSLVVLGVAMMSAYHRIRGRKHT